MDIENGLKKIRFLQIVSFQYRMKNDDLNISICMTHRMHRKSICMKCLLYDSMSIWLLFIPFHFFIAVVFFLFLDDFLIHCFMYYMLFSYGSFVLFLTNNFIKHSCWSRDNNKRRKDIGFRSNSVVIADSPLLSYSIEEWVLSDFYGWRNTREWYTLWTRLRNDILFLFSIDYWECLKRYTSWSVFWV